MPMLKDAFVCATVPTTDLERSRRFYEETLGLTGSRLGLEGGLYYEAGGGSVLHIDESAAGATDQSIALFLVEDLDGVMTGLRGRGVAFEERDDSAQGGYRSAWFRDPDGNLLGLRSY
jgi:catechol 2,3-dioxygenase-like lactoylglutathione lyase family enzyme